MTTELFRSERFNDLEHPDCSPVALFRDEIAHATETLKVRFNDGAPVKTLVLDHGRFIDRILNQVWVHCRANDHKQLALVAVGGYGRGELHPHSDIDLMILTNETIDEPVKESIERFLLFLWDIGLEVGHSVRNLSDSVELSKGDITIATTLMESRLIVGTEPLYRQMKELTDQRHLWPGREFFEAKWQEQIVRHRKYNDTAYNLEPNVKEGPGGMRDIQMIGWVAKRHFAANSLADLVSHGFLTHDEYETLDRGQNFLWKVRYALHLLANRREDRLLFDHQRSMADQFGYLGDDIRLAVEKFMKDYYRTVMELERLNEMLLQLFQEDILYRRDPGEPRPINERFQLRKGFIEVSSPDTFKNHPSALFELFLLISQNPNIKGVRAETIRLIRNHLYLIDNQFRSDPANRALFIDLLRQPQGITHQLRRMNRYGILAAYLPPFGHAVGLMQHDLFHVYTVDEHTLRVVRNLRRFAVADHNHEFPLCSRIIATLDRIELIYIAGIFHDIAKGLGGDHSTLGAAEAEKFCRTHNLSGYDTRLVVWLIKHHLVMSMTAQRKDISAPEVINEFATMVGDKRHLDFLFLLTVADIRATSPSIWNSWKASLLERLYLSTHHALRRGLATPILQDEIVKETRKLARELLMRQNRDLVQVEKLWQKLGEEYFLRYYPTEIGWHATCLSKQIDEDSPVVAIRNEQRSGGTAIFIHTRIRGQEFTTVTHVLDTLGLNIVEARIIPSHDQFTLDTYTVLDGDGQPISDPRQIERIEHLLREHLTNLREDLPRIKRRVTRQLKQFDIPTEIAYEQEPEHDRTVIEVITGDRPGVLSSIADALKQCNIRLHTAKIATLGERVEDIFYVTDTKNNAISDSSLLKRLETILREALL